MVLMQSETKPNGDKDDKGMKTCHSLPFHDKTDIEGPVLHKALPVSGRTVIETTLKALNPMTTQMIHQYSKEATATLGNMGSLYSEDGNGALVRPSKKDCFVQKVVQASLSVQVLYISHHHILADHTRET